LFIRAEVFAPGLPGLNVRDVFLESPLRVLFASPDYLLPLAYVDNGDGTVTDNRTKLQWEKKGNTCVGGGNASAYCTVASECPGGTCSCGPHCVNNLYSWTVSGAPYPPDGTVFTSFLATLNGGDTGVGSCASNDGSTQAGGFAGHCDWRLPAIEELRGIVDLAAPECKVFPGSCIDETVFGPTIAGLYWSASTQAGSPAGRSMLGIGERSAATNSVP
jgi:hypothetical protein